MYTLLSIVSCNSYLVKVLCVYSSYKIKHGNGKDFFVLKGSAIVIYGITPKVENDIKEAVQYIPI